MRYIFGILLLILVSGCDTLQVRDTQGVLYMLNTKATAESLKTQVQKTELTNKGELMKLYSQACAANNGWIDGLKFNLQAKDVFEVKEKDYIESKPGLSAEEFIKKAESSLPREQMHIKSFTRIGGEIANAANEIINNIVEQNNKKVKEARERISSELEKSKWKE